MTPPVVVERRRPREHDRDTEGEHARLEERSPWVERQGEVRPPDEGKRAIDQRRVPRLEHPTDGRSDRNEEQERRRESDGRDECEPPCTRRKLLGHVLAP